MSRIRSIKPEFWTSAQILECSTNARLLFIGLWNFCDDLGRHPFSPKQAKAEIFPADAFTEGDILGMLKELSANGLILVYSIDNKEYLQVTGWKHQRIDKPQPPKYPGPFDAHSGNTPGAFPPDRIGEDRKREDKKDISPKPTPSDSKRTRPSRAYPEDFEKFWLQYPDRTNNSKGEALRAWERLSTEDRLAATGALPAFAAYCRKTPDYRVVHCVRFLAQRRFESWASRPAPMVEMRV